MNSKINAIRDFLDEKQLAGVMLTKPESRRYITGFTGSSGIVLITKEEALFITDFRYEQQAADQCPDFTITLHNASRPIETIINEHCFGMIGFEEDHVTYKEYQNYEKKLSGKLVPFQQGVEELRIIKSTEEVEKVSKAAAIADETFTHLLGFIKPGMTELEVAHELEFHMKKLGASGNSFEPIVASGWRSALPHGKASGKVIQEGEFLTLDFGCIYEGYCSDMTRTIFIGQATDKHREIYDLVLKAEEAALEAIKAGALTDEVDQIARDIITQAGYGPNFGHGLGHGVGLEVHEAPRLAPNQSSVLQAGMIVTDEPGIYIPDFGGVRIEDLVLVTENGREILSKSTKEFIELK